MKAYRLTRLCILLFVLDLLSWHGSLQAQPVRIGLEAGVNQIAASFVEPQRGWYEPDIDKTFHTAMFVDVPLRKQLAIQPGIRFLRYETNIDYEYLIVGGDELDYNPGTFKITQSYLLAPLLLKYTFDSIYILGGPELGFLLSAQLKNIAHRANIRTAEYEVSMTEEFHRFNLSLNVGCGYEIKVANSAFFVQAQYIYGLTNLNKPNTNATFLPWEWSSREINLSLGYLF